jgi:phosphatidylserine/phosphatidylglycerophosphate/cardiolipin synthase-like enzyme
MRSFAVLLWCIFVAGGCASLPQHVTRPRSAALEDPLQTTLGRVVEASSPNSRGLSGIRLLPSGSDALASLIALADHAERTLDIQYYIIQQDESAHLLLNHVRAAANRGVRVRLLIDDFHTAGQDRRLVNLGRHVNIEVRLFNPFPGLRLALWTRILASLSDIPRINHRMHNKLFVADNALAVTGGRNIGDQYFVRDKTSNFIDLDVVAAGPIVPQLSASFDEFWNSKYAYPVATVASPEAPLAETPAFEPAPDDDAGPGLAHEIETGNLQLLWVPATVLADRPAKIALESASDQQETVANDLAALMRGAKEEVLVISPYFVPGADGMSLMRDLSERGVHVKVLTNSLASTDSPLAHIGYAHYREALLRLGVELDEVRPQLGQKRRRFHPFRYSTASLHAKALVIDQKTVFIGSLNMDARSKRTNSELGLILRSAEIAGQVTNLLEDISAEGSWRLRLAAHGGIEWVSGEPGAERSWFIDPETTRLQRFSWGLLAPFAPEEML